MMNNATTNTLQIGDTFETDGRCRTVWSIASITKVPRNGTMVQLSQVDGLCRITVPVGELCTAGGLWRARGLDTPLSVG